MIETLNTANRFIWGGPVLLFVICAGVFLSLQTRFAQLSLFPRALKHFLKSLKQGDNSEEGVSSYQALCTALAATVGTGNLAGVAGAIAIGGPGAVFWMWICAFLGMVIKYAEATLAVKFKARSARGETVSGPMYMISEAMGPKYRWLACIYCVFGVIASLGVGNAVQVNTVIGGFEQVATYAAMMEETRVKWIVGPILAVLIWKILSGGKRKVASITERLIPVASCFYILLCFGVLLIRSSAIDNAFCMIFAGAFSPRAVTGGVVGSFFQALRVGASRGTFTNEAGMGTAAIAHGCAKVEHPVHQGLMGIMEVFLDTVVICTLTALVILCSGVSIPYGDDTGISLTTDAFSRIYGDWVTIPIAVSLCLFAIATIIGWGYYGARCAEFLFGSRSWKWYVRLQTVVILIGAVADTGSVWVFSEIFNGLMAIPNLTVLLYLVPEVKRITLSYQQKDRRAM